MFPWRARAAASASEAFADWNRKEAANRVASFLARSCSKRGGTLRSCFPSDVRVPLPRFYVRHIFVPLSFFHRSFLPIFCCPLSSTAFRRCMRKRACTIEGIISFCPVSVRISSSKYCHSQLRSPPGCPFFLYFFRRSNNQNGH